MLKTSVVALLLSLAASCSALSSSMTTSSSKPNPAIKAMAQGMNVLAPIFKAEAQLQASVLGSQVDVNEIQSEIEALKKQNKVLIYTYKLSPFSTEALALLEASGYEYTNIELGAEWFLLGGKESVTRVQLAKQVASGATSLPKIFIGGTCIGGCAELSALAEAGKLDAVMKKAGATKKGEKKKAFSFF